MKHTIQGCAVVGIDLAKNSFAIHSADALGHPLFKATCSRSKLLSTLAKAPACQVYMEACSSAHHLFVAGSMAVIVCKQRYDESNMSLRLTRMLSEKPKKVVAITLANRMARLLGHIMMQGAEYDPNKSCIG